jgi:hypothetical protein
VWAAPINISKVPLKVKTIAEETTYYIEKPPSHGEDKTIRFLPSPLNDSIATLQMRSVLSVILWCVFSVLIAGLNREAVQRVFHHFFSTFNDVVRKWIANFFDAWLGLLFI